MTLIQTFKSKIIKRKAYYSTQKYINLVRMETWINKEDNPKEVLGGVVALGDTNLLRSSMNKAG